MNRVTQTQIKTKNQTNTTISQPIPIPANTNASRQETIIHQYSLKQGCFNPNNASPPSSWNYRLMQRISDEVPIKSL